MYSRALKIFEVSFATSLCWGRIALIAFLVGLPTHACSQITGLDWTYISSHNATATVTLQPFRITIEGTADGNREDDWLGFEQRHGHFYVDQSGYIILSGSVSYASAEIPGIAKHGEAWACFRGFYWPGFVKCGGAAAGPDASVVQASATPLYVTPGATVAFETLIEAVNGSASGTAYIDFKRATPDVGEPVPIPDYVPGGGGGQMQQSNPNHCVWVIHGMNDGINLNDSNHWASKMKQTEFAAGNSVFTWDWRQGAQADLLSGARSGLLGVYTVAKEIGTAYRNASFEGVALANDIRQRVANGECQLSEVQLIGHSYGGVVAAVAADILSRDFGEKLDELVLIDTPNLSFLDAVSHVNVNSVEKIINLFGGRWEGAVGGPFDGANVWNLGVDLPGRGIPPNPSFVGHKQMPYYWPEIRGLIQNWVANQPAGIYREIRVPGAGASVIVAGAPDYSHYLAPLIVPQLRLPGPAIESLQEWRGYGARLVEYKNRLAVELDESAEFARGAAAALEQNGVDEWRIPPATIGRSLAIPEGAQYLRFEFAVPTPADGDRLVVSFAASLLFEMQLFGTQDEFVLTPPIYVGDLPTDEHLLSFAILRAGRRESIVYLSSLEFFDVPLPGDLNDDRIVDRADLARFTANYGRSYDVSLGDGDLNADGKVSLADLIILHSYMNSTSDEVGPGVGLGAVPEPPTQLLALLAIAVSLSCDAWRRRLRTVAYCR